MTSQPIPAIVGTWLVGELILEGETQATRVYRCSCSRCGRVRELSERQLRNLLAARRKLDRETVKGCERGCYANRQDVRPGQVFGLWTVEEGEPTRRGSNMVYPVVCRCGRRQMVSLSSLKKGAAGLPGGSGGCRSCTNTDQHARRRADDQ